MKSIVKKSLCSIALVMILVFSGVQTASAVAMDDSGGNNATVLRVDTRAIDWKKYGWLIVKYGSGGIEKLITLDGQTVVNGNYAYLVSPTIHFNFGDTRNEFYFRPNVTTGVGSMTMHGHRTIGVDVFSKISLTLSDANGVTVANGANTSNQYLAYTPKGHNSKGSWKASYQTGETKDWQCYYTQYAKTRLGYVDTENGFYFTNDGYVYSFSSEDVKKRQANGSDAILNLNALNDQFVSSNGKTVDYLKDYQVGDSVRFSDRIASIEYSPERNATSIGLNLINEGKKITWMFNGDLRSEYTVGDDLQLTFHVVGLTASEDVQFSTLDYFKAANESDAFGLYPHIEDYR